MCVCVFCNFILYKLCCAMISTCFLIHYSTFHQFSIFLNILFILFQVSFCAIPQASQEDRLHSFKSYSDVAIFHYTVPKEVERATWHFAAFMDNPVCQPREVYIHLRFGSYPVIPTNNRTFLTNTYVNHDDSIIVTAATIYESKNVTIVRIDGPQSGDWFVAAYMPYWNERVQQQGFGHKCQYSIGTIALWSQRDNIENIPVGYKMILRTSARNSYYKIYIPSGIWNFRLSIWNCTFVLHNFSDIRKPCIDAISLKGRVLPTTNNSHSMEFKNLTINANYTFTEFSPYEDSHYYLLIVTSSVIEFNIKIEVSECPIRLSKKSFTRESTDIALNFNSARELNINDLTKQKWYYKESNISRFYNKIFYQRNEKQEDDDSCMLRHQLVRVQHAETFSATYLLQENELSSRVVLIDSIPVMTQFDILPLIDIGGVLDVSVHLETGKLSSKQSILVTLCIQKGRVPKLRNHHSCQNGTLSINLSSLDKHDEKLLIAYPQPDTWYIITYATCYYDDKPVHCKLKEISILLEINTGKCMLSKHKLCGNRGVCQEIQKNILHYATCNCFEGYTGWDCTDFTNPAIFPFMSTVLLIFSNAFFIPAIYISVKRKLYAEGLVYLATMLISSLYHACDQTGGQFCIVKYEILQYSDFFSSILAFWMTLVAMAELPTDFISLCHVMGVFIITIGVQIDRTSLISILIPLLMGVVIPIVTHIYRIFRLKKCKKPSQKTSLGLLFAITGLLLYSFVQTKENYYYVHSMWHIIIAISVIFLLPPRRSKQKILRNTSCDSNTASFA